MAMTQPWKIIGQCAPMLVLLLIAGCAVMPYNLNVGTNRVDTPQGELYGVNANLSWDLTGRAWRQGGMRLDK